MPWIPRELASDWSNTKISLQLHNKSTWLHHVTDLFTKIGHLSFRFQRHGRDYSQLFKFSTMAKYYREISQLLALGEESFEDELRRIVSDY